jgi:hypothetical protein
MNSLVIAQTISWNTNDNSEYITNVSKQGFTIKLQINKVNFNFIKTNNGDFYSAEISGFGKNLDYGNPALPVYKRLIELPEGAHYDIEVVSKHSHSINLDNYGVNEFIFPAQLPIPKVENPNVDFQFNKKTYKSNSFYSNELASILPMGKLRSTRLARIEISPISYNPQKNQLLIVDELTLRVKISGYNFEFLKNDKSSHYSPFFQTLDKRVINSEAYKVPSSNKTAANKFPVKYVIVSDSIFKQSLQPFVRWKEKEGYKIIEAYTQDSTVGNTTTSIKAYLQGLYNSGTANDPAPTFVLFVGDIAQLPSWQGQAGSHVSDLYYCEFTGDEFPEMMYGRFSATDTSELNSQINKTIEYETYSMPDPSFLATSVLIAGYDASHGPTYGDGQINYGTTYYFNSSNSTNCKDYLYVNGSYNKDAEIRQQIDSGVSIANYTAHGFSQGWADPSFNVSHVANMTNQSKYPLMLGNACLTNKFDVGECFGEALLRAKNKGAIGYIGASDNTLWDEDYYWAVGYGSISANPTYNGTTSGLYDMIFHTHNEAFSDWAMNSYQYMMAGNLAVTQGGSSIRYYWEVYHLMGDPSLMTYLKIPDPITASYVPFIQLGWTSYTVATVPHALVALSKNDTLISSAFADSLGVAVLELGNFSTVGNFNLTITAQNHAPYFATVFGGAPSGPYVISTNTTVNDSAGNNNGFADFGENIKFDMQFVNLTSFTAHATGAVLQINDSQVVVNDSDIVLGDFSSYDTINSNNTFDVSIVNNAIDHHIVNGTIKVTDSVGTNWYSNMNFDIFAPNITVLYSLYDDSTYGNDNGVIEAGEQIIVKVKIANKGRRDAVNIVCNYVNSTNEATVSNNVTFDTLHPNTNAWASFNVVFNSNLNDGTLVPFTFDFTSGAYAGQKDFPQFIGQVDEDFETGDLSLFAWQSLNSLDWGIDTIYKYEGQYSSRSNSATGNDDTSSIYVNMHILVDDSISFYRKVSTEEGYDKLHFYIDGTELAAWSGNKDWKRFSYPVTSGMHTFKWSYIKDVYTTSYMDATWIDYIKFPPTDAWSSINKSETSFVNEINLLPNPATEIVNLEFELSKNANVSTSIYNQMGQLIVESTDHGKHYQGKNNIALNISSLSSGVYVVKVDIDNQSFFHKLIIK